MLLFHCPAPASQPPLRTTSTTIFMSFNASKQYISESFYIRKLNITITKLQGCWLSKISIHGCYKLCRGLKQYLFWILFHSCICSLLPLHKHFIIKSNKNVIRAWEKITGECVQNMRMSTKQKKYYIQQKTSH